MFHRPTLGVWALAGLVCLLGTQSDSSAHPIAYRDAVQRAAWPDFEQEAKDYPESYNACLDLARYYLHDERLDDAQREIDRSLGLASPGGDKSRTRAMRAELLLHQGKAEEAIQELQVAADMCILASDVPALLVRLGDVCTYYHHWTQARDAYRRVIGIGSSGLWEDGGGFSRLALAALASDAKHGTPWLAISLARRVGPEEAAPKALDLLDLALRSFEDPTPADRGLIWRHVWDRRRDHGDREGALKALDEAASVEPDNWANYWLQIVTLLSARRPEEVATPAQRMLATAGQYADVACEAHLQLARCHARAAEWDSALTEYAEAALPGCWATEWRPAQLALYAFRAGRAGDALRALVDGADELAARGYEEEDSEWFLTQLWMSIASLQADVGEAPQARESLRRATAWPRAFGRSATGPLWTTEAIDELLATTSDVAIQHWLRAWLELHTSGGDPKQASASLQEALDAAPGLVCAYVALAEMAVAAGNAEDAGPLIDTGLANAPEGSKMRDELEKLGAKLDAPPAA